jgi:hypothetical protein
MYEFWIVENFIEEKLNVVTAKNCVADEQIVLPVLALWLREHLPIYPVIARVGIKETNGVRQKAS